MVLLGSLAESTAGQIVRINEVRPLRSNATVELRVVSHAVVVQDWDRNEIQIVGEYDADRDEIDIGGNEDSFYFEIDQHDDGRGRWRGSSRLEVRVHRGVRLSVATVSGSLDVSGLNGALTAEAVWEAWTSRGASLPLPCPRSAARSHTPGTLRRCA